MHPGTLEGKEALILDKHKGVGLEARVVDVRPEPLGGTRAKDKFIAEAGKKRLNLVIKEAKIFTETETFGEERIEMTPAQRYFERWRYLRKLGIPTVSSMRVVDDKRVAMGDMTADGSAFFGRNKWEDVIEELDRRCWRDLAPIEKVFLALDPETIKDEVANLAELAWANGLRLPVDDPGVLWVRPDGSFTVLVMDVEELRHRQNEPHENLVKQMNEIVEELDYLRGDLKKLSQVRYN